MVHLSPHWGLTLRKATHVAGLMGSKAKEWRDGGEQSCRLAGAWVPCLRAGWRFKDRGTEFRKGGSNITRKAGRERGTHMPCLWGKASLRRVHCTHPHWNSYWYYRCWSGPSFCVVVSVTIVTRMTGSMTHSGFLAGFFWPLLLSTSHLACQQHRRQRFFP